MAISIERRRQSATLFTQRRGVQFSIQKSINNPRVSTPSTVSPTAYIGRNQLATPRRHLPLVTASYTLTPQGKMRIGKRNNAVLRKYYDVVAMERDVVSLRPKPSTNETLEEDLAAARRDPC